jgi:hypothetical protein
MNKDIFIILPFKESLEPKKSGAVSIYIKDSLKFLNIKKELNLYHQMNSLNLDF